MYSLISLLIICYATFAKIDILAKATLMIASGVFAVADAIRRLDS